MYLAKGNLVLSMLPEINPNILHVRILFSVGTQFKHQSNPTKSKLPDLLMYLFCHLAVYVLVHRCGRDVGHGDEDHRHVCVQGTELQASRGQLHLTFWSFFYDNKAVCFNNKITTSLHQLNGKALCDFLGPHHKMFFSGKQ